MLHPDANPACRGAASRLLHSERTTGIMAFETKGTLGEQLPLLYSQIYFKHGKDTPHAGPGSG